MTVSNVLNDRPVAASTRDLVLQAIRDLNYQPSAIARGLNRKPMDTLGVVIPHVYQSPMSHPFCGPIMDGILGAAVNLKRDVTFYTSVLWSEVGEDLRHYRDGRTDGLILITPMAQKELIRGLLDVRIPFVCVGSYWADPGVNDVCVDDVASEEAAVRHLVGLGHRRIAFIEGVDNPDLMSPRRIGFLKALVEAGIPPEDRRILSSGFSRSHVAAQAAMLAGTPPEDRPTAITCFNDEIALMLLDELLQAGLRVPEDISLVGFDDAQGAAEAGLTTLRQPMRQVGARAAQMLVDLLADRITPPQSVRLSTELIVRSSTGPPAQA